MAWGVAGTWNLYLRVVGVMGAMLQAPGRKP